jgi:CheY-like chemotaxis protein
LKELLVLTSSPLILLVDDDRGSHDLFDDLLVHEPCKFVGARGEEAAKRITAQMSPDILALGARSTAEALAFAASVGLPKHGPRMLILAGAGTTSGELARLAALGPVLTKPLAMERLRETLRNLIQLCAVAKMASGHSPRSSTSDVWRRLTTACQGVARGDKSDK